MRKREKIESTIINGLMIAALSGASVFMYKTFAEQDRQITEKRDKQRKESEANKLIYERDLEHPLVATVFEEHYDSCLHGSRYALTLQMEDGRTVGLSVAGESPELDSLQARIEKGDRISFPATNINPSKREYPEYTEQIYAPYPNETDFTSRTSRGTKHADRITIIPERF